MTHMRQLAKQARRIALGYLLIHFHIKLNGFDLLPDVLGWVLIFLAVRDAAMVEERPKVTLLRGFALAQGVWSVVEYLPFDLPGWVAPVSLVMQLVSIYFYFQLLTELAGLAEKYPAGKRDIAGRLLKARTIVTVLRTATVLLMALRLEETVQTVLAMGVLVVQWVCCMVVIVELFALAKGLERRAAE